MNPFAKWMHVRALKRTDPWSSFWLDSLPIHRKEPEHKYVWEPTNESLL